MEWKLFSEIHLQRKNNVRSLASVTKAVKVCGQDVCINPNQLFHRIVCIVRSEEELAGYLTYELVACPSALSMIARYWRETNPPLSLCWMTWHPAPASRHLQQCTPLTVVIFYIVLFGSIQQRMDALVSYSMDMTLPAQRTQSTLAVYHRPGKFS